MNFGFPYIEHINDVLRAIAIKGRPEFFVVEKDQFTFINYNVAYADTFPDVTDKESAILRECRGLVFDSKTGIIVSRRLHKFFNLNEKRECDADKVDLSKPHVVLDKVDGSMITFLPKIVDDQIIMTPASKMGFTDTAVQLEPFLKENPQYQRFALYAYGAGLTPIFEWCSPKNTIVIRHNTDKLVLIAIRDTKSGEYTHIDQLKETGKTFNIPVVDSLESQTDIANLAKIIREKESIEGVVVRFDDGHMVKIKTEWYVLLHKTRSDLDSDKKLTEAILSGQIDDLRSIFSYDQYLIERINKMEEVVSGVYKSLVDVVDEFYQANSTLDRKSYAILAQKTPETKNVLPFLMAKYLGKEPDYKNFILKNLNDLR